MASPNTFGVADYCIFAATIAVSLGIGIYSALSGGRQKTTDEFLVANRNMKVWPVCVSLLVSFESSVLMLGIPGDVYVYGFDFIICVAGMSVFICLSGAFIVPLFHNLKVISVYEYLQARFGSRSIRLVAASIGMCQTLVYMGVVLYGPATALEAVSGYSTWYSLLVIAAVAMIYTSIGGIKAVIWADVFQSFIMLAGILSVIIMGTISVGGFREVVRIGEVGEKFELSFSADPTKRSTFWTLIASGTRGMRFCIDQISVQRAATLPNVNKAKIDMPFIAAVSVLSFVYCHLMIAENIAMNHRHCNRRMASVIINNSLYRIFFVLGLGFFVVILLACFEGLVAFAYYAHKGCDPLAAGYITNPNQIVPYFVLEIFRAVPGVPGLFMAALFSASLSTLSSGYGSMSAIVWTDFIKPSVPEITDFKATIITKVLVLVFGVLSVGVAILVQEIGGTLIAIALNLLAVFSAPLVGTFLLAAFFSQANYKGALAGCLVSTVICFWKGMGSSFSSLVKRNPYQPFYSHNCTAANYTATLAQRVPVLSGGEAALSYFYSITFYLIMPIGVVISVFVGLIVSFITGRNKEPVDSKYLIPFVDMCCCCLPKRFAYYLRFKRSQYPSSLTSELAHMFDEGALEDQTKL